jgi:diguanylate cyclase (GGDEF)-like protein
VRPIRWFLVAFVCAVRVLALEPSRALTQARLATWTTEDGLPQNTVDAIVQTRDGYLWLGTEEGVVRFDGARFVVHDRQSAPALGSAFISSLFEGADGALWIGTYGGGLSRLRNNRVDAFRPDLLGNDRIREMHASGGAMYVATAGGGVLRIIGENVTRITTRNGLPTDRVWAFEDDGAGGLWIATHGGGVVRFRGDRVVQRIANLPNEFARALLVDADGTMWVGTDGGGLAIVRHEKVERVLTTRDGLPSDHIRALHRDRDGSLWIGTDAGLARWRGARVESMAIAEGLPSPVIRSVVEDREGSLWVGTTAGLVRLSDTRFLPFTRKEGITVDTIRALYEDRDGRVWAGTEGGGLCAVTPTQCITKANGLPHDTVYALAGSRDGSFWIGTDGGGVVRARDGRIVETIAALANARVRSILESGDGTLWISTTSGLTRVRDGVATRIGDLEDRQLRPLLALPDGSLLAGSDGAGLWRVRDGHATRIAGTDRGLRSDRIFSLALDRNSGAVWIGTSGGGLGRLDLASGTVRSLSRRDGLHDDVVFQLIDDGNDLWMTSNRGLYRVARERVLAAMEGRRSDLSGTVYGSTDGMPSTECNAASPSAIRTRDGRLWIATARGIAVVDVQANPRNLVPPHAHVEEVLLDGVPAPAGPLRVPPGTQRLDVRYTATALRAPERARFRYKLEGYDDQWVDAGANRVAHYTKLAAGDYTFRVSAINEDGVRSIGEATRVVTVEPRWFETWWARLLGVALLAAAVWAAMRLRVAAALEATNRELAVANTRLRALSYIDGLTGVANRRRFDEALEEACASAAEEREPVSLVLLDLDHFKRLNDTHGHHHGDDALRTVGALLSARTDLHGGLAARYGGEEFAWLLPGVELEAARREAEALRLAVRNTGIVTASLGVATGDQPQSLVAAADQALYRAKSNGRDRVES